MMIEAHQLNRLGACAHGSHFVITFHCNQFPLFPSSFLRVKNQLLGSSASLNPSPMKLTASTANVSSTPGAMVSSGAWV